MRAFENASKKDTESGSELKSKSSSAIEMMMSNCNNLTLLENIALNREEISGRIRKYAIQQIATVLTKQPSVRRSFVERGMLRKIQGLNDSEDHNNDQEGDDEVKEIDGDEQEMQVLIEKVLRCFPLDVVQHYSDEFGKSLVGRHFG